MIYIDADEVLVDFMKGCCEAFGKDYEYEKNNWPKNKHSVLDVWNITEEEFVSKLDINFWENLKPTPLCYDIIELFNPLNENGLLCIVSSHSNEAEFAYGKVKWFKKYLPHIPYSLCVRKEYMASEGTILIDDFEKNVINFKSYGGNAILYPSPWNRRRKKFNSPNFKDNIMKEFRTLLRREYNYLGF